MISAGGSSYYDQTYDPLSTQIVPTSEITSESPSGPLTVICGYALNDQMSECGHCNEGYDLINSLMPDNQCCCLKHGGFLAFDRTPPSEISFESIFYPETSGSDIISSENDGTVPLTVPCGYYHYERMSQCGHCSAGYDLIFIQMPDQCCCLVHGGTLANEPEE